MADWPSASELQTRYGDLLNIQTTKIDLFLADAKARVQKVMAQKYDVTLWTSGLVPTQCKAWCARLAHAYFQQDVHFGASPEAGSNPATTVRDQVEQEMKDTLEPDGQLLDDAGVPIPINLGPSSPGAGHNSILLRTIRPVFGMGQRERERVFPPDGPTTTQSSSRWR